jgi:hypothetical protein
MRTAANVARRGTPVARKMSRIIEPGKTTVTNPSGHLVWELHLSGTNVSMCGIMWHRPPQDRRCPNARFATIPGMVDPPLKKLRAKRIRIHKRLDKLEPKVAGYRAKLAAVEAAIQAPAPELPLPTRHRTYQPNPYFVRGELPRIAVAILREAGEPLPIRVIATRALARKGCATPDRRVFKITQVRLQQLFLRLEARGVTFKVGKGNGVKRGLRVSANRLGF